MIRSLVARASLVALTAAALTALEAGAQAPPPTTQAQSPDGGKVSKFFQSETPIAATLTSNFKRLRGDRPDKDGVTPWRAATIAYTGEDGAAVTVPVRIRTRGIWRLKNCDMPPIRLNFSNENTKKTIFKGLDKPKLVGYCQDRDDYEDYILKEFQLYRVYHLLTPASHAVRLLKLTYADSGSGKTHAVRYAFVEEDPGALAERLHGTMSKAKGALPDDLEPVHDVVVGLFQYLIGNTDFALSALHNSELFASSTGEYWPIVYDFDFSGAVNARYATADPSLHIQSVRHRLYRGYCVPAETYPGVVALFNAKKSAIYGLYSDSIGKLMRPQDVRETLSYFDEFYKTINDPRAFKDDVIGNCIAAKKK